MSTNQPPDPQRLPDPYSPPTRVSTLPHHVRVAAAQKTLGEFQKHVYLGPKLFAEWEAAAEAELDAALAASNAIDQPQIDAERERRFELADRQEVARLLSMQAAAREADRKSNERRSTEQKAAKAKVRKPADPKAKAEQNRKYRESRKTP